MNTSLVIKREMAELSLNPQKAMQLKEALHDFFWNDD
jgi:hypothetical protein